MIKLKRKWFILTLAIIFTIISLYSFSCNCISFSNYNYNQKFDDEFTGLIVEQEPYNYIKYGCGNIENYGCGAICLYNILYLDGKPEKFSKIIKELDSSLIFFGLFGSNPFTLTKRLRQNGYNTKIYLNEKDFKVKAKESKFNILVYYNLFKYYGHYQLFYDYNNSNNTFRFLNPTYTDTLESYMEDEYVKSSIKFLITVN